MDGADVVVYGATGAGVAAAVAAREAGAATVLVEPGGHVGGMVSGGLGYPIPYRSLTPRREDSGNLLVPVCLSASHVAFGSVRMEPTLMLLGHAAGAAAAQSARRDVAVQDVDVGALQEELAAAGQVLAP